MRSGKPVLLAVIAVAFAIYLFDCGVTMTAKDAMECCKEMPCSSHGHHDQNCCKSMPTMQVSVVQSASARSSFAYVPAAVISVSAILLPVPPDSVANVAVQCHAPPGVCSSSDGPLRI